MKSRRVWVVESDAGRRGGWEPMTRECWSAPDAAIARRDTLLWRFSGSKFRVVCYVPRDGR